MSRYKCPLCGERHLTIYAVKIHVSRKHGSIHECPACHKPIKNIYAHLYNHMLSDSKHLLYFYLYTRFKVPPVYRKIIMKLLEEGVDGEEVSVS